MSADRRPDPEGTFWPELELPREMRGPEVRRELYALSREIAEPGATRLRYLAAQLWRAKPIRRAPPSSRPMTAALALEVRTFAQAHPDLTEFEIGRLFGVNQGRVSEALAGFRGRR